MTKNRKNPRQKRLHAIFVRFLLGYGAGAALLACVVIGLYFALIALDCIRIPSYEQNQIMAASQAIRTGDQVEGELLPDTCSYGVYSREGSYLYGTLSGQEQRAVWEKGRDWQTTGLYGKFWQRIEKDNGNIAFISYQVMAKFVSPALRSIFPNAELLFLAVLGLLLAALTVVVPRFFGRYVDRRLLVLSRAAARVEREDLDFGRERSDIREIDQVLGAIYKMKEALRKSLREQWELEAKKEEQVCALAHDIRTPLTIIRGNAELFLETEDIREIREWDREILDNVEDIEAYLSILQEAMGPAGGKKDSARAADGGRELFPVRPWMEEIAERAQALGRSRQVQVICRSGAARGCEAKAADGGGSWVLAGDKKRLSRAVLNVISNAVDHSPEKGKVQVRAETTFAPSGEGRLTVAVEDEGPGFSREALQRATERFYQDGEARRKGHYGMGLYIARTFAEEAGGSIRLANLSEGGAQVLVELPLLRETPQSGQDRKLSDLQKTENMKKL